MHIKSLHPWQVDTTRAVKIQQQLAGLVSRQDELGKVRYIAGMDISSDRARAVATAAIVVLEYPGLKLVEMRAVRQKTAFPYVPGLLSFRESPLLLEACKKLTIEPDLVLVDGQGYAHPRRMGLACHIGLLLEKPTIGCAKSLLIGTYEEPLNEAGRYTEIRDGGDVIGEALRTKTGVKPVYVSIGHKVSLAAAVKWVLLCSAGYRIPEPLRLAHQAAGAPTIRNQN